MGSINSFLILRNLTQNEDKDTDASNEKDITHRHTVAEQHDVLPWRGHRLLQIPTQFLAFVGVHGLPLVAHVLVQAMPPYPLCWEVEEPTPFSLQQLDWWQLVTRRQCLALTIAYQESEQHSEDKKVQVVARRWQRVAVDMNEERKAFPYL